MVKKLYDLKSKRERPPRQQDCIIRSHARENYKIIPNAIGNDKRLSWEARGMMLYLLSKKDTWILRNKDLENQTNAGRDKVNKILKELVNAGYIVRERSQDWQGKFTYTTYIYDEPE